MAIQAETTPTTLADMARRLKRGRSPRLPRLWLLTDERRLPDPLAAARRLPAHSAVVLRHYGAAGRSDLAARLAQLCRARRLIFLVAGDVRLAARVRADGVHLPERLSGRIPGLRRRQWLVSVAAHSRRALAQAGAADAVLLSPVFATESHAGAPALGVVRFAGLAHRSRAPVIALGGIDAAGARRLAGAGHHGYAAIGALAR